MVDSAVTGSAARLAHACYMMSVAFTSVGDSKNGSDWPSCLTMLPWSQGHQALSRRLVRRRGCPYGDGTERGEGCAGGCRGLRRHAGNRWIQAFALTEVLELEASQGQPRQALKRYADVIDIWYRGGDWANQWLHFDTSLAYSSSCGPTLARRRFMGPSPPPARPTPCRFG